MVSRRDGVPGVSPPASLASWLCLSPLRGGRRAVGNVAQPTTLSSLRSAGIGVLGLGSYETAWTWLHKLRRAMVRPGRDCLFGEIEIDEAYVGGPETGKRGRQTEDKAIVVVAAEKSGRGIGRIRLCCVADVSADSLISFVQTAAMPGSTITTDGWSSYARLSMLGYRHHVSVISAGSDPAHVVMPRVHKVVSLLRRWLMGTHQGGIQRQHLDYYLDEFTFRFNRRRSKARGLLFHRLAQQAVAVGPAPYRQIITTNDPALALGAT